MDLNKKITPNENENDTSKKQESTHKTGAVQQNTSKNLTEGLVKSPRELADEAAIILKEQFGTGYAFVKKEGFHIYHIAKKDTIIQLPGTEVSSETGKKISEIGNVKIVVTPTGKLNISLYDDTWKMTYSAENMSNEELIAELESIKKFISENVFSSETKKFILKDTSIKTPRELANEAESIIYREFLKEYTVVKQQGTNKYHIARKDSIIQLTGTLSSIEGKIVLGEGQMIMEVNDKGKLKIRLTSDDGMVYYRAEGLSNEELITEIPAIKKFIGDNSDFPSTSRLIKETPFEEDNHAEDITTQSTIEKIEEEASISQYYHIPSLTEEQKRGLKIGESIDGWVKEKISSYLNNNKGDFVIIKKMISGTEEKGYVREYIDGMPERLKGVQFFNEAASKNLGVYEQLFKDEDIPEKRNKESVLQFINKYGLKKTGKYDPKYNEFVFVDDKYIFMLQNGKFAEIDFRRGYFVDVIGGMNKEYGYPIILSKK